MIFGMAIGVDELDFYAARNTWTTLFVNEYKYSESLVVIYLNHLYKRKMISGCIKKISPGLTGRIGT